LLQKKLNKETALNALITRPVLLYDGECPLCNRVVAWLLKKDKAQNILLCAQQSDVGKAIAAAYQWPNDQPDYESVWLATPNALYVGQEAVIRTMEYLNWEYKILAFKAKLWPVFVRNWAYRMVSKNRKKLLKPYVCEVPLDRMLRLNDTQRQLLLS
jgi:predicted DCC family thiol-disulfide oxidoreductase YuxK